MASAGNHRYAKALVFEESSDYNSGESNTLVCQNGILYFNGKQLSSSTGNQFDIFTANKVTRLSGANIQWASNLVVLPTTEPINVVASAGQGFQSDGEFLYYNGVQISAFSNIYQDSQPLTSNSITPLGNTSFVVHSNLVVDNVMFANTQTTTIASKTLHFSNNGPQITFNSTDFNIQPVSKGTNVQFLGASGGTGSDCNVNFVSTATANVVGSDVVNLKFKNKGDSTSSTTKHTVASLKAIQSTPFNVGEGGGSMSLTCRDPKEGTLTADDQNVMLHMNTHPAANTIVIAPDTIAKVGIMAGYTPTYRFQVGSNLYVNDDASKIIGIGDQYKILTPSNVWFQGGGDRVTIGSPEGTQAGEKSIVIGTAAGTAANVVSIGFGHSGTPEANVVKIGSYSSATKDGSISIGNRANAGEDGVAIGSNSHCNAFSVSVGIETGASKQGKGCIAIGNEAGQIDQAKDNPSIGEGAIAIGYRTGNSNQGVRSVAVGNEAGRFQQGSQCVAVGFKAGTQTQQIGATAIGHNAGFSTQGSTAIAVGSEAGLHTQQANAIAIGYTSGYFTQNTAAVSIGVDAGYQGQHANSVAIGISSGKLNQHGNAIAIGMQAGFNSQNAYGIAMGFQAGASYQGEQGMAFGLYAGESNQGKFCQAIGGDAGRSGQMSYAIAIGQSAGFSTQGVEAVAISRGAGASYQGQSAVAIGSGAGFSCQGVKAVAIGWRAARFSQNTNSVSIGTSAGESYQDDNSIAIGESAGASFQGSYGISIGYLAGSSRQNNFSIATGYQAGYTIQGPNSIAIGRNAGYSNQGDAEDDDGGNAIAIGYDAGYLNQDNNSIAIGTSAGREEQGPNAIAIGVNAGYSNQTAGSVAINGGFSELKAPAAGFYINPVRGSTSGTYVLEYNTTSKEITYNAKTFVIDHPDDKEKYLVHGCLEGPEGGVYYRGRGEVGTPVNLPNYVPNLIKGEPTIQVTPIYNGSVRTLNCSEYDIKTNSFEVFGTEGPFYWTFTAKRCDVNVEPLKAETNVNGNGPYLFTD